jgi:cell division septation protein DedD
MLFLAGCEEGAKPLGFLGAPADGGATAGTAAAAGGESALTLVERDVEAPSVFDVTDEGLWDGRPSLGGVWVAHSTVSDPERVIIRNTANGKSVIGALFRREQANPGPALQVSSDAAIALEMLAGQPAELTVVALRREEVDRPVPAEAEDIDTATDDAGAEPVAEGAAASSDGEAPAPALDPVAAAASAAIDKAEGVVPAEGEAALATDTAKAAPAPLKPCPFWRKKKCEAERAAALAGGETADAGAPLDDTAPEGGADAGAIESATLDAPAADGAIPATAAAAGELKRPFVQIGIFSVQENAQRAADQMRAAGMQAQVKTDQSQGKTFWRVIVGPAASVAERDALAAKVKGIGYPDAYPVGG